jgi:hypothetical protein
VIAHRCDQTSSTDAIPCARRESIRHTSITESTRCIRSARSECRPNPARSTRFVETLDAALSGAHCTFFSQPMEAEVLTVTMGPGPIASSTGVPGSYTVAETAGNIPDRQGIAPPKKNHRSRSLSLTLVRTAQQQRLLTSSESESERRRSARIGCVFGYLRLYACCGCRLSKAYPA